VAMVAMVAFGGAGVERYGECLISSSPALT
jgi:hypothetical protein